MKLRPHGLSNKQFEFVGRIIMQYNYLDLMLSELIRGLVGMSEDDAIKLIRPEFISKKTKWLKSLIDNKIPDIAERKILRETSNKVETCDRNLIAHGLICYAERVGSDPLIMKVNGKDERLLTEKFLQEALKEIEDMTDIISDFNIKKGYVERTIMLGQAQK